MSFERTAQVRRPHHVHGRRITPISRERGIGRTAPRRTLRSFGATFQSERRETPTPKLGGLVARLGAMPEAAARPRTRGRCPPTRSLDDLRRAGSEGGCDAVRRHARRRRRRHGGVVRARAPLTVAPGGAVQFDWRQGWVLTGGMSGSGPRTTGQWAPMHALRGLLAVLPSAIVAGSVRRRPMRP